MEWVKRLGIKHFRGIYSRDGLPSKIKKECGIINLDDITGPGTHWVCYRNITNVVEYFDPLGLIMPNEVLEYFHTGSVKPIVCSIDEIQNRNTVLCGYGGSVDMVFGVLCIETSIAKRTIIRSIHKGRNTSESIKMSLMFTRPMK